MRVLYREVEIGWTFPVRSHWGGATNREVKRLMLDHAFTFVETVIFWVGEATGCSRSLGTATRTADASWWSDFSGRICEVGVASVARSDS
jgi:hypothetical protein